MKLKKNNKIILYFFRNQNMESKRQFCRIQIGANSRINQQTKERMKMFFNEILSVMETIQPGEEKTLEFLQSSGTEPFDDNISIDVVISKESLKPNNQGIYLRKRIVS